MEIKSHRLGAYVYGFLSGLGLILIIWGLASIIALPSTNAALYISIILFGVALFAIGSCREAYLRGSLSPQPSVPNKTSTTRNRSATSLKPAAEADTGTARQVRRYPVETQTQEAVLYEEEQQTAI